MHESNFEGRKFQTQPKTFFVVNRGLNNGSMFVGKLGLEEREISFAKVGINCFGTSFRANSCRKIKLIA